MLKKQIDIQNQRENCSQYSQNVDSYPVMQI